MSFDNWFGDDDEDFLKQLKEMQKRVSHLMKQQLKEIIDALKGGEMHGQMHIKPIDGPGIKGYVMWGQLSNAPDFLESKQKKLKPLATEGLRKGKTRVPMFAEAGDEEGRLAELRKPLVEKFRSKDEYVVLAELPGLDECDLKVDVRDGILEISAGDKFRPTRIRLPQRAQAKRLKSSYKNGILEIRIPRGGTE
nr:Hsp20/alpha crystallin family protein [Candidatus Njordarchaeum guaymaensis]